MTFSIRGVNGVDGDGLLAEFECSAKVAAAISIFERTRFRFGDGESRPGSMG